MQPLHAFFDDNQGPHKIKQWVGNDLDFQAKLKDRWVAHSILTTPSPKKRFREDEKKEERSEQIKKARTASQKTNEQLKASRELRIAE